MKTNRVMWSVMGAFFVAILAVTSALGQETTAAATATTTAAPPPPAWC